MTQFKALIGIAAAAALAACATVSPVAPPATPIAGWTATAAETGPVDLGLPGGAVLASGVHFAGGIEIVAAKDSPFHSLSDFKLIGHDGFVIVSDAGDLFNGRLVLDARGRLAGITGVQGRRLSLINGQPIVDKVDGDAEGLIITDSGDVLVSFERNHRIWNYGRLPGLQTPTAVRHPDFSFPLNDGMEGISAAPNGGWRVTGENGGVWDCRVAACDVVQAPPEPLLTDADFRPTGLDRDPAGGWFQLARSYRPPIDARAQVRRMAADGTLGPVLIELKLPGTTDNFEGLAAQRRGSGTRLYILSDDNNSATQRTLLLAFDID